MQESKSISLLQFAILIITTSFGTNLLTLPRKLAEEGKQSMWLIVFLGSILILISFWFAVNLSRCFPKDNVIQFNKILMGNIVGNLANLYLLMLMLLITASILRTFVTAIKGFLLDLTPPLVIITIVLLAAVYTCQNGLGPMLRFQQMIFESSYFLLMIVILIGILNIDTDNYEPFLAEGIMPVVKATKDNWFVYSGPEILVLFFYPYFTVQRDAFKYGLYGIGAITFMYVLITAIVQGILGYEEVMHQIFPTVMAYREVEIPATFIERIDGYLMIIWVAVAFVSITNWLYLLSLGIGQMLKMETNRSVLWLLIPVLLYLQILPPDFQTAEKLQMLISDMGMIWGLVILPVLWGIAKSKQRRNIC